MSCISVSQAQPTCQSNYRGGSCVTSESCFTKHTPFREGTQCRDQARAPIPELPLISGRLEECPYDFYYGGYSSCPNSQVDDPANSVGPYGKPDWVGAELQSVNHKQFSLSVMWSHSDAEKINHHDNYSRVQGYEIRVIQNSTSSDYEETKLCFCVLDPTIKNISNIQYFNLRYEESQNMVVEVGSFPSLRSDDQNSKRRNCSLLSHCVTSNAPEHCSSDCYSWPQSCLSLPHNSETCNPPLYSRPVNVKAEMSLIDSCNAIDHESNEGLLSLSWEPPIMNYDEHVPVPNVYYVTITSTDSSVYFRAINTTIVSIRSFNYTAEYNTYVVAYVPCSGVIRSPSLISEAGCGAVSSTNVTRV